MASRGAIALAAALAALLLAAPSARPAETPMPVSYLDPYNMDWLAYLDPADVPPNPYAVCVVDTGVAITPDTPPDNPAGPIVKRYAFDGGTGEPQTTNAFGLHGTRMAMAAAAPANDWGTVGAWPGARIISMRATKEQEQFIRLPRYEYSTFECVNEAATRPVGVVLWSLSCAECEPVSLEEQRLDDAIAFAHQQGVSIVAAAGNRAGPPHFPAVESGVFGVAAGSSTGALCADSAFSERVAVVGPGCPVESTDPLTGVPQVFSDGGTSSASAIAATLIAALRSLRPQSTYEQVETWVRDSARVVEDRRVIDGIGAARLAGVGATVDRAIARMPVGAAPSATATPIPRPTPSPVVIPEATEPTALMQLPRPERANVVARIRGRELRLRTSNRPPGASLEIRVGSLRVARSLKAVTVFVSRSVRRLDLRYLPSRRDLHYPSSWLRLRRQSGGRFG